MTTQRIIHRIFLFLMLSLAITGCQESAQEKADRERSDAIIRLDEEKRSAYVLAEEVVSDHLPSPSAAIFPYFDPNFLTLISPHHFLVSTYMDLPDRAGRRVRGRWSLEVRKDGDKFLLDHINIIPGSPLPGN